MGVKFIMKVDIRKVYSENEERAEIQYRIPAPNWSEAPWGLSVLAQVTSIFTGISISPDALSRQRPHHYAFRAGQNLPDKEFRYLRTVIVTAAVYWGLNSKLCLR